LKNENWKMQSEKMSPETLEDRLIDFAARVGCMTEALPESVLGRHVARQVIRSATSPAPNYAEGCAAESRRDFVHKLSISLKELRETRIWLRLVIRAKLLPPTRLISVQDECDQLCAIIAQSIITAKRNGGD